MGISHLPFVNPLHEIINNISACHGSCMCDTQRLESFHFLKGLFNYIFFKFVNSYFTSVISEKETCIYGDKTAYRSY